MAGNLAPGLIAALGMRSWGKSDEVCAFAEPALSVCRGVRAAAMLMLSR